MMYGKITRSLYDHQLPDVYLYRFNFGGRRGRRNKFYLSVMEFIGDVKSFNASYSSVSFCLFFTYAWLAMNCARYSNVIPSESYLIRIETVVVE